MGELSSCFETYATLLWYLLSSRHAKCLCKCVCHMSGNVCATCLWGCVCHMSGKVCATCLWECVCHMSVGLCGPHVCGNVWATCLWECVCYISVGMCVPHVCGTAQCYVSVECAWSGWWYAKSSAASCMQAALHHNICPEFALIYNCSAKPLCVHSAWYSTYTRALCGHELLYFADIILRDMKLKRYVVACRACSRDLQCVVLRAVHAATGDMLDQKITAAINEDTWTCVRPPFWQHLYQRLCELLLY